MKLITVSPLCKSVIHCRIRFAKGYIWWFQCKAGIYLQMHWTEKFPCLWRPILLLITFTAASLSPPPLMYLTIKWGKKVTNTFLQSDFQVRVSPNQLSDPGLLDPCLLYQIIISRIFVFRLIVFRPWTTFEMFWYRILVNKYFFVFADCIFVFYFVWSVISVLCTFHRSISFSFLEDIGTGEE